MKIAILGTAPTSRDLAPFADPEWSIWACSPGNEGQLPRVDVWFEIHALQDMTSKENHSWVFKHYAYLAAQNFTVIMQEKNAYVPKAEVYPLEEMIKRYGRNWFTSSIAYMLALAIAKRPEEIALFGVDMAAGQEKYTQQRAGCVRFIEFAEAAGIKVTIPRESSLGTPVPLYGYAEASPFGRRLQMVMGDVTRTIAQLDADIDRLRLTRAQFGGGLEQLIYIQQTWVDGRDAELSHAVDAAEAKVQRFHEEAEQEARVADGRAVASTSSPHLQVIEGDRGDPSALELGAAVRRSGLAEPLVNIHRDIPEPEILTAREDHAGADLDRVVGQAGD